MREEPKQHNETPLGGTRKSLGQKDATSLGAEIGDRLIPSLLAKGLDYGLLG